MTDIVPPTPAAMRAARRRLGDLVIETPVLNLRTDAFKQAAGKETDVVLKLELMQFAGSFKPRGALNVMMDLTPAQLAAGVTAVSAGNHAIAVAYASRVLGTHARVVMPKTASRVRVDRVRAQGGEVVITDDVHQAFEEAHRLEREEGRFFVHPFEGERVAEGTGTLGLEFVDAVPDLDAVIVPIGGGGLCAGVAAAVKQTLPGCRVYGVEPEGADSMSRSFAAGKPMAIDKVRTIADSLGAPYALPYSYALCRQTVDRIVTVSDDDLCRATALLFHEAGLAVEPAGASATAALCGPLRDALAGKRVGLIVCGSNIDSESFYSYLKRGEAG